MTEWKQYSVPVAIQGLDHLDVPAMPDFGRMLAEANDRYLRPWKYPDQNPMPMFAWWPWIDEIRSAWNERSERIAEARSVLRHGVNDRDEW